MTAFDGFEMPVYEDEFGRRWCQFPRPFRLYRDLNDWLVQHNAYKFAWGHFVIDDEQSSTCIYLQVDVRQDGRHWITFLTHRDHWPHNIPIHAKRMTSTEERNNTTAQLAQQGLALAGAGLLAAALFMPRSTHIYHHRSK